VRGFAMKAHIT